MSGRSVLLCGATGLVGHACLGLLLEDAAIDRVVVFARRPVGEAGPAAGAHKLDERIVNFDLLRSYPDWPRVDAIICALGTTMRDAGSRERFRAVDQGYVAALAARGIEEGASQFLLVSAIGANPRSLVFYSRVKGEAEASVRVLPWRSVTIVRPSLLQGHRPRRRRGEALAQRVAFLVPPKYKPVTAETVATVLVREARDARPGVHIFEAFRGHLQELPAPA